MRSEETLIYDMNGTVCQINNYTPFVHTEPAVILLYDASNSRSYPGEQERTKAALSPLFFHRQIYWH